MRPFDRQRILLGVTGGIASYKAAWLARLLTQACAEVGVVMTRATSDFIGTFSCEALTGRPVHRALVVPGHATTAPTKLVPSRRDAVGQALSREDALHMTAAPDDFTAVAPAGVKIKKAESGDPRSEAHRTLVDQGLDLIVANDALKGGAGFAVDTNRVTIGHVGGREENLTRQSTTPAADENLRRVEVPLHGR